MDRERAETFLRLLAEAELRDPRPPERHAGGATDFPFFSVPAPVRRAAWALTAVQALDVETADRILTDVELALAMRQQQEPTEPGQTSIERAVAVPAPESGQGVGPEQLRRPGHRHARAGRRAADPAQPAPRQRRHLAEYGGHR